MTSVVWSVLILISPVSCLWLCWSPSLQALVHRLLRQVAPGQAVAQAAVTSQQRSSRRHLEKFTCEGERERKVSPGEGRWRRGKST